MKKNTALSLILGVAVSAAALYFAFTNVPLAELLAYLTSIDYWWMLPALLVALLSLVFKVIRWQIILGKAPKIDFWQAYHPMIIGFMLNCVLPGRVGEVARPIILRQKTGIPFSTGIATVAAERVFDLLLLVVLFVLVVTMVDIDPNLDIPFGNYHLTRRTLMILAGNMVILSLVLIAGIIMIGFHRTRRAINRWIMAVPAIFFFAGDATRLWIARSVCEPVTGLVDTFSAGFSQMKDIKMLLLCIGLSIVTWMLTALSYYVMAIGCPGMGLNYFEITAMMVIICFFIALPSVPGFWGIWEAGGVFALLIFGVNAKDAAGYTLASHAAQLLPIVLLGIASALITGINILKVSRSES